MVTRSPTRRPAAPVNAFAAHCSELLSPLGPVRSRRMFGGHGLYVDDLFIGLILRDQLYLKSDAQSRPRYLAAGCEPFRYSRTRADGTTVEADLSFFQPPEDALESPALMRPWGRLAMESALRSANAKGTKVAKAAEKTKSAKPTQRVKSHRGANGLEAVKPSPAAVRKKTA
ncbi:TfoX/Sxy family protein [Roseateles amylovorans]|uniref:TfoX/Sxy family protein n=1 Tax=Roseateles amylovorans TaxID=2978473 RepID=A0ABY6B2G4_9BURK|nr:TfoX/Sxy family protein [Roseateles amylovorans]UXH79020.1 TfoX/Sxy family protein [Roseateles amylovorans]